MEDIDIEIENEFIEGEKLNIDTSGTLVDFSNLKVVIQEILARIKFQNNKISELDVTFNKLCTSQDALDTLKTLHSDSIGKVNELFESFAQTLESKSQDDDYNSREISRLREALQNLSEKYITLDQKVQGLEVDRRLIELSNKIDQFSPIDDLRKLEQNYLLSVDQIKNIEIQPIRDEQKIMLDELGNIKTSMTKEFANLDNEIFQKVLKSELDKHGVHLNQLHDGLTRNLAALIGNISNEMKNLQNQISNIDISNKKKSSKRTLIDAIEQLKSFINAKLPTDYGDIVVNFKKIQNIHDHNLEDFTLIKSSIDELSKQIINLASVNDILALNKMIVKYELKKDHDSDTIKVKMKISDLNKLISDVDLLAKNLLDDQSIRQYDMKLSNLLNALNNYANDKKFLGKLNTKLEKVDFLSLQDIINNLKNDLDKMSSLYGDFKKKESLKNRFFVNDNKDVLNQKGNKIPISTYQQDTIKIVNIVPDKTISNPINVTFDNNDRMKDGFRPKSALTTTTKLSQTIPAGAKVIYQPDDPKTVPRANIRIPSGVKFMLTSSKSRPNTIITNYYDGTRNTTEKITSHWTNYYDIPSSSAPQKLKKDKKNKNPYRFKKDDKSKQNV